MRPATHTIGIFPGAAAIALANRVHGVPLLRVTQVLVRGTYDHRDISLVKNLYHVLYCI